MLLKNTIFLIPYASFYQMKQSYGEYVSTLQMKK